MNDASGTDARRRWQGALDATAPPEEWPALAKALWWDAHGDWERAHQIAQTADSSLGARVHAYLHRVEGDLSNAGYWYQRAGGEATPGDLAHERLQLTDLLLRDR